MKTDRSARRGWICGLGFLAAFVLSIASAGDVASRHPEMHPVGVGLVLAALVVGWAARSWPSPFRRS